MVTPIDLRGRVGGLDREGDAGGEAAARERHEDGGEVGAVLDELEADGALAGDDAGVVEGRDLGEALPGGEAAGLGAGLVLGAAGDAGLGAEGADRRDLGLGDERRHADDGAQAAGAGGEGEGAAVVAGRGAGDAGGAGRQAPRRRWRRRGA